MKMILLENALEAWSMAIFYCDEIMSGKATLTNKKYFVSSLQNSVELFVKQIMLNLNDYRVAEVKQCDCKGEPLRSYLASQNLNEYFKNISGSDMKKFFTIEFNKIKEIQRDIFKDFLEEKKENITEAFNLLQKLRNDETHFYISEIDFMLDNEFEKLYNFMIIFFEILRKNKIIRIWGRCLGEKERYNFQRSKLKNFSYEEQLKQSSFVKNLKNNIEGEMFSIHHYSAYDISKEIIDHQCSHYSKNDFNELWAYIKALQNYKMLEYTDHHDKCEYDDGTIMDASYREYKIKIS